MRWFRNWLDKVDIGLRPRNVFEGTEINLYPFTARGAEWRAQNLDQFTKPEWSSRDRCLLLSEHDCRDLTAVVQKLDGAGLKIRFYGRLKRWDGKSPMQPETI